MRVLSLLYGFGCYFVFFLTFLYMAAFLANVFVPKSIDSGVSQGMMPALWINLALILLFALQHSVMARGWFKNWITKIVPSTSERSTYVLFASIALIILFAAWQPLPGTIWKIENTMMRNVFWGLCGFGWLIVLLSTFFIDHFELFGLKQTWYGFIQKLMPQPEFKMIALYKLVRHPIYLGFLIALWSTPDLTVNHAVFAAGMTAYMFIGVCFEEKDLIKVFGQTYRNYQQKVPRIIPIWFKR